MQVSWQQRRCSSERVRARHSRCQDAAAMGTRVDEEAAGSLPEERGLPPPTNEMALADQGKPPTTPSPLDKVRTLHVYVVPLVQQVNGRDVVLWDPGPVVAWCE